MPSDEWRSPATHELFAAILALRDRSEAERFFRDLCTLGELHDLAQRWQVVRLLDQGKHYGEISRETGASTATVTRIAQWLNHGTGGYRLVLERRRRRRPRSGPTTRHGTDRVATRHGADRVATTNGTDAAEST